jgi:hypothetical protein
MVTHKDPAVATMTYEVGLTYCFYPKEREQYIEWSKFDMDVALVTTHPALL